MLRSLLIAALAALILAAPARAADVSVSGGTVTVAAAPGEANRLTLALGAGVVTVQDTGAPLTPGDGCVEAGASKATCPVATPPDATVGLGDGDDTPTGSPATARPTASRAARATTRWTAAQAATCSTAATASTRSTTRPAPSTCGSTSTTASTTARTASATTSARAPSACWAARATTASPAPMRPNR